MVKKALGAALLLAATALVFRAWMALVERSSLVGEGPAGVVSAPAVVIRPVPTVSSGRSPGSSSGMTSVGSGSIVIVVLLFLYPMLKASQLVGTDLTQAIPMVAAAALGHILFGDFKLGLAATILVGAIPGVYVGARLSSRAPGGLVRRALAIVLLASGLKLLGASNNMILLAVVSALVFGNLAWARAAVAVRQEAPCPARGSHARRARLPAAVGGGATDWSPHPRQWTRDPRDPTPPRSTGPPWRTCPCTTSTVPSWTTSSCVLTGVLPGPLALDLPEDVRAAAEGRGCCSPTRRERRSRSSTRPGSPPCAPRARRRAGLAARAPADVSSGGPSAAMAFREVPTGRTWVPPPSSGRARSRPRPARRAGRSRHADRHPARRPGPVGGRGGR